MGSACVDSPLRGLLRRARAEATASGDLGFQGHNRSRRTRGCARGDGRCVSPTTCTRSHPKERHLSVCHLSAGEDGKMGAAQESAALPNGTQKGVPLTIHSDCPRRLWDPNKRHRVKTRLSGKGQRCGERLELHTTGQQPLECGQRTAMSTAQPQPAASVGPQAAPCITNRKARGCQRKRPTRGSYESPQGCRDAYKCD